MRKMLKMTVRVIVLAVLGLLVLIGINAIDEQPSSEARALIDPVPDEAAIDGNGYLAFLGFAAAEGEDPHAWGRKALAALRAQEAPGFVRDAAWDAIVFPNKVELPKSVVWCEPAKAPCLAEAAKPGPDAAPHRLARERYERVRAKPEFRELYLPVSAQSQLPHFQVLRHGQQLVFGEVRRRFSAGDMDGALQEIERSTTFHRRVLAGGRTLIGKMVAGSLLARDLLLLSEILAAQPEAMAPHAARIESILRPFDRTELALGDALRTEYRFQAQGLKLAGRSGFAAEPGPGSAAALAPLLFRPNETLNALAARMRDDIALSELPSSKLKAALQAVRAERARSAQQATSLINPTGKWLLSIDVDLAGYAARMHDLGALANLVRLQHALAAGGHVTQDSIASALAGPLGRAHLDPYTGQPMVFDATSGTLGFEPAGRSSWSGDLAKRWNGKVAIRLR